MATFSMKEILMESLENQLLVEQFFQRCWNDGMVDLVDDLLAPEHVHHLPGRDLFGPAQIKQLIANLRNALSDFHITMDDEIVEQDKVVIRWTIRGIHQGKLFGMRPTGKEIKYSGIDIVRCANGKIVELWGQFDSAGLTKQLQANDATG